MSEAVASRSYSRPRTAALGDPVLDMNLARLAASTLSAKECGVWFRLYQHLWNFGELPAPTSWVQIKRLAGIGGVPARAFAGMMPALAPLFDVDAYGRWGDRDLERQRDERLGAEGQDHVPLDSLVPAEFRPRDVDPKLSAVRSQAARSRWGAQRSLKVVEGGLPGVNVGPSRLGPAEAAAVAGHAGASESTMQNGANGDAKPDANGDAKPVGGEGDEDANGAGFASDAPSKLASLESELIQTDASELAGCAGEHAAMQTDAKPPARHANRHAKPDPVDANGPAPAPTDAAMLEAIVRVCRGKVDTAEAYRRLPVFRTAMADGLDFRRDILPELEGFARRNTRVENCANKHVLGDARARADSRRAVAGLATSGTPGSSSFWVDEGSPQWQAWLAHKETKSLPKTQRKGHPSPGFYFPSEWPPEPSPQP